MPIDTSHMIQTPTAFCNYANEAPSSHSCDDECYCKSHTCLVATINKEIGSPVLSKWRGRQLREQTDMDMFMECDDE